MDWSLFDFEFYFEIKFKKKKKEKKKKDIGIFVRQWNGYTSFSFFCFIISILLIASSLVNIDVCCGSERTP